MDYSFLDRKEYGAIPLLTMEQNMNGLPFYIRKYRQTSSEVSFHRHQYIQINYINAGRGKHRVNNHTFELIKGDIFVIPPFVPHCLMADGEPEMEIFEFEFEPSFINQSLESRDHAEPLLDFAYIEPFLVCENQVKPRLNLAGGRQTELENLLNEVMVEYKKRDPGFDLMIKSLLLRLLVIIGREFTRDLDSTGTYSVFQRHRDAILGAIRYIDENYQQELNAEDVARRFLLSSSYFRYLFRNITLRTFTEYVNRLRISKAMELLSTTDQRVLDICEETGFNSVNYFDKVFRQQAGVSPLAYRRQHGESQIE